MRRATAPNKAALAFALCLAFLPAWARAGGAAEGRDLKASDISVILKGSSTLHGWLASAGSVSVTARLAGSSGNLPDAVRRGDLSGLDLVLAVDSLKTTESSGMDRNLRNDLEAGGFPEIRFSLKRYEVAGLTVTARGELGIHGVTHPVVLTGLLLPRDGTLDVQGDYPLRMSDYGVKPPVMLFGTVKVADTVDVAYHFKLSEQGFR